MKALSPTRWQTFQISIVFVVWFGLSTANSGSNSIFNRHQSGKECPVDTRVNDTGILTVTNSTQQCQWRMKTLIDLKGGAIIFNTKNMDCDGGSLNFVIDHKAWFSIRAGETRTSCTGRFAFEFWQTYAGCPFYGTRLTPESRELKKRNVSKNFCNQPNCLVFARLRSSCNDNALLNKIVQNLFGECDDFEWYIKPHPLLITASSDARNFEFNYTMFDCPEEIVTTISTKVTETTRIRMENTSTYASNMEIPTTTIDYGPLYPTASPGAVSESTTQESTTKLVASQTMTTKIGNNNSTVHTTPSPSGESDLHETTTKIARTMTTIEVEATPPSAEVDLTTQPQTKMTAGTKVLGTEASKDPEDRADELAIIFNSNCENYEEVRIDNSATLTVTNTTTDCFLKMRKLDHLKRQAVIYNTKGMSCNGGSITFPIYDNGKRRRNNFCNHTKCLVYVKENGPCINEERLRETVQNLSEDCNEFEWYIKPKPFDIRKSFETKSFTLNYTLFNCENEVTTAALPTQELDTTESPITREPKETKAVIAVANTGSRRRMEAWWIILPLVLIALIAIALSVGYLLCCKSSKRKSRRINGKDEHISTIAL